MRQTNGIVLSNDQRFVGTNEKKKSMFKKKSAHVKKKKERKGMDAQRRSNVQKMRQMRNQELALRTSTTIPQHLFVPFTPVQLDHATVPVGIVNMGNTCYLNATLQCLRYSTPFVQYLLGEGFARDRMCLINRKPMEQAFLGEYYKLMTTMVGTNGQSIRPSEVLKLLVFFNQSFLGGAQSDAQECLTTILQTLHKALCLNVKITVNVGDGESSSYDRMRKGIKQYESHLKHDGYSVVDDIFGSQFESRLTCDRCGHIWASFDPYNLIPIEVVPKALTLYDCLDQFTSAEHLDGITCERCGPNTGATKQFRLWTLPKMMILQLKRFDPMMRKLNQFIQAPKTLNITKYISHPRVLSQVQDNPVALQLYDLKGIICHTGQLQGGHYTAKCYNPGSETVLPGWYDFNDERTTRIPNEAVDQALQSPANYILFYEMNPMTRQFWAKNKKP